MIITRREKDRLVTSGESDMERRGAWQAVGYGKRQRSGKQAPCQSLRSPGQARRGRAASQGRALPLSVSDSGRGVTGKPPCPPWSSVLLRANLAEPGSAP